MLHIDFWRFAIGCWLCDHMPLQSQIPWCLILHGLHFPALPDDDPCWERAGWSTPEQ